MSENVLIYESVPLDLTIDDYQPYVFEYEGYKYSDSYSPPKDGCSYGKYVLFIASKELNECVNDV